MENYNLVLEDLMKKFKAVNRRVFKLRLKSRRYGLSFEETYKLRQLGVKQKKLSSQIRNIEIKLGVR